VLIKQQNSWNIGRTNFKQCASCNSSMWLQEFSIAIGFIVLCVKGFMCSSLGWVLNGTFCTSNDYALLPWSGLLIVLSFFPWVILHWLMIFDSPKSIVHFSSAHGLLGFPDCVTSLWQCLIQSHTKLDVCSLFKLEHPGVPSVENNKIHWTKLALVPFTFPYTVWICPHFHCTRCLVTLCQYLRVIFLRSFPDRNFMWTQVRFSTVMQLQIFEIQDDFNFTWNIRVIRASCRIKNLMM
jgi:hypothetical protein